MIVPAPLWRLGGCLRLPQVVTRLSTRLSGPRRIGGDVPTLGRPSCCPPWTEEQKNHYLPRRASGDVPLSLPHQSPGRVSRRRYSRFRVHRLLRDSGKARSPRMRVTLGQALHRPWRAGAPCLGLAFRLFDPDGLLGEKQMWASPAPWFSRPPRRRNRLAASLPLNAMFMVSTTRARREAFMPLIHHRRPGRGPARAGGCSMEAQRPAAPSPCPRQKHRHGPDDGGTRRRRLYARVRSWGSRPLVGRFEGVEEAPTRIGAYHLVDAALQNDRRRHRPWIGEKPSVASAIVKYHVTERGQGGE